VVPILSTNGVDFQGVWHEWARALRRYDGITELRREARCGTLWYGGSTDPEAIKLVWDELLSAAGVQILYLAHVADAIVEDGRVKGVVLLVKSGLTAVLGKRVVDATGDGDVCAFAGCRFEQGAGGAPWAMGVSLNGWYGNVPTAEGYEPGRGNPVGGTGRSVGNTGLFQAGLLRMLKIDPLDPWNLSRAMRDGRRQIWERYQAKRRDPTCRALYLAGTAAFPGIRSSRRICGIRTSTAMDAIELRKHADGVARASWEIDIHSAVDPTHKPIMGDPDYANRVRRTERGDYYDIPYGCLVPADVDSLYVAGRCISAEHESQASLRIQQTCMSLGQAAGTAAALSVETGASPRDLDVPELLIRLARDRAETEPFLVPESIS
jgi:hypothetical protein